MKKGPYLKKFSEIDGFSVWIVDGKYIRDNINIEFTNFGQNYQFDFIPKDEFWIDNSKVLGEEEYYIKTMLRMNQLMDEGLSHEAAYKIADYMEKEERMKEDNCDSKSVYVSILKQYSNSKLKIWIVDGRKVRTLFFTDFTQGGNDKVYSFIPENEIWIDNSLLQEEIKFVLLHELHERKLMLKGMKYDNLPWEEIDNDTAHKRASKLESYYRKYPKEIGKALMDEIKELSLVKEKFVCKEPEMKFLLRLKNAS